MKFPLLYVILGYVDDKFQHIFMILISCRYIIVDATFIACCFESGRDSLLCGCVIIHRAHAVSWAALPIPWTSTE